MSSAPSTLVICCFSGDWKKPTYVDLGIIIGQYKDPFEASSIMECHKGFERYSCVLGKPFVIPYTCSQFLCVDLVEIWELFHLQKCLSFVGQSFSCLGNVCSGGLGPSKPQQKDTFFQCVFVKTCMSYASSTYIYIYIYRNTSSTAQGGGGSFKNRKRIGEIDCCEWRMSEQKHWPTD